MNINQAIEVAKSKAAGTAWAKSVAKAADTLLSGELIVTVLAGDNNGLVSSANGCYHIRHGFCDCPSRVNHCYHISALRICTLAETATSKSNDYEVNSASMKSHDYIEEPTRADVITDIKTTFAAKHPGFYLSDTVQKLCGPYSLNNLGIAKLQYVLSAIA